MRQRHRIAFCLAAFSLAAAVLSCVENPGGDVSPLRVVHVESAAPSVHVALFHDTSPALGTLTSTPETVVGDADEEEEEEVEMNRASPQGRGAPPATAAAVVIPDSAKAVEQTTPGNKPPPQLLESFDGLGVGFPGPQGGRGGGNPSDSSLAVGPNHIFQIVNSRFAIYTKKGDKYPATGQVLFGPVNTNTLFKNFGDAARINSGDAVVRYDQLADRWLIVLPIFSRLPVRPNDPPLIRAGEPATRSHSAVPGQPMPEPLTQPAIPAIPTPPAIPIEAAATNIGTTAPATATAPALGRGRGRGGPGAGQGPYAVCYAVSATSDPLGAYYRYEFLRPLFPDYPRPAVWIDGYYVPTSTGDTVIQKQAYVADRAKMLKGEEATEQGVFIDNISFLNNTDIDGKELPPPGSPNIMMADGGRQLSGIFEDDGIYVWKYHVDWDDPSKTKIEGPTKITVAPYHFLGNGQLSPAVPQPDTNVRLDSQGDKLMQRLVYRRIGNQESILAVHSVSTSTGGGGVRWYEFRIDDQRNPKLYQQGTYCPEGNYRWLPSPDMDSQGNIGIGYSFGGTADFPGQRFAARMANDPLGQLTLHEAVLAKGEAIQPGRGPSSRWEDYVTTCMDPTDDRTMWYVGDYIKQGATTYSTKIGSFRIGQ